MFLRAANGVSCKDGDSTGSPRLRTPAEGVSFPSSMASPRRRKATPSDDDLAEQLRAAGLRRTQPRIAVLRYMRKVGRPVTHAEVTKALAKLDLDRVSVYRVLVDLARVKILARTDMGDHVWRFDVVRGDLSHAREHPH